MNTVLGIFSSYYVDFINQHKQLKKRVNVKWQPCCWVTIFLQQDHTYDYDDKDNLLASFSIINFKNQEIHDALQLNGEVKHIHKIRSDSSLGRYSQNYLNKFIRIL